MRGTLVLHNGAGSGSHFGTLHSQLSPGTSETTVIGHFLLEVPSHSCSCGDLWSAAIRLPDLELG